MSIDVTNAGPKTGQEIWVVFNGRTDLPWLRLLKPGFRHCYVMINDGERWVSVDPLSHYMEIVVHHHLPVDFDLPGWLEKRGLCVVKAEKQYGHTRPAPAMPFSCVEAVKRILGIHKRFLFTPWQLYRHLRGQQQTSLQQAYTQPVPTVMKGDISWAV